LRKWDWKNTDWKILKKNLHELTIGQYKNMKNRLEQAVKIEENKRQKIGRQLEWWKIATTGRSEKVRQKRIAEW